MGKTIAEKILGQHADHDVKAGDFVLAKVDVLMGNDGSLPLVFEASKKMMSFGVRSPKSTLMVLDHYCPSPSKEVSRLHEEIRDFARRYDCLLYDCGEGICHRLLPENGHVLPGMLVVGADSHTVTYGGLNLFATGVGSTDLAVAMNWGVLWFRVPETILLKIDGGLPKGLCAKDIALFIIGSVGSSGANSRSIEFRGQAIDEMNIEGRLTLCNMMVEMGAKSAIMPYDEMTDCWLNRLGINGDFQPVKADDDAENEREISYDTSEMEPQIAFPHQVDYVQPIFRSTGIPIDMAFLGTCTNGGPEDLKIAARILKKRRVHSRVRFIVSPSSRNVVKEALAYGFYQTLIESGAVINPPGCGPCVGAHGGIPADHTNVLSTANRNFLGRMGNREANIYLCSPATLAASAIRGEITDPREFLE
ncbi:MAG: 3-isopropylmalate dehydratase large subunit [Desulfobacteraceae bacterium]|nr:MAG: 3-isopropylmalate dehydratase large subunit [Desulfobacteraceae bacterium]